MSEEIQLCNLCKGKGFRVKRELIGGHNLEVIEHKEACAFCGGTGRVVKTVTTTYEPYVAEEE